jgi:hypothetical protein
MENDDFAEGESWQIICLMRQSVSGGSAPRKLQ